MATDTTLTLTYDPPPGGASTSRLCCSRIVIYGLLLIGAAMILDPVSVDDVHLTQDRKTAFCVAAALDS